MTNIARFRVGDVLSPDASDEVLLVTAVNTGSSQITVTRGYGASTKAALQNNQTLSIIANAALEGADAADARYTIRARKSNFTQIFTATVQVSGSEAAARQLAVENELDYQKIIALRELLPRPRKHRHQRRRPRHHAPGQHRCTPHHARHPAHHLQPRLPPRRRHAFRSIPRSPRRSSTPPSAASGSRPTAASI